MKTNWRPSILLTLIIGFLVVASPAAAQVKTQTIAFINVNIVPMDAERIIKEQTVIIRDGRVTEIGPASKIKVPKGAFRVDGRGKYLMPGLVDVHTHITDDVAEGTPLADDNGELFLYIANGVTTVRNMKGRPKHLQWRKQIAGGELLGPTLYTCGPTVLGLQDPEAARRIVNEQAKAGYDCIKVYSPPDWSKEAYEALIKTAKELKIPAVGHFPRNLPLEVALTTGQASVDHAEEFLYTYFFKQKGHEFDEALILPVAKATREAGISVTPTFAFYDYFGLQVGDDTFQGLLKKPELKYVPRAIRGRGESATENSYRQQIPADKFKTVRHIFAFQKKLVKALHDAGVRIMVGTDSSWNLHFVIAGFSVHEELRHFVGAGLTPYQALRAATINPAEFLQAANEFGTVSVGKRADLVLVEANPLEDVTNASRRTGVMVRGRWLPEAELQRKLQELAASYAKK